VFGAQVEDVRVAALAGTVAAWSRCDDVFVDMEGHGRQPFDADLDVSRTVGWFTTIYPVALRVDPRWSSVELLQQVTARLRAVPEGGLGYGLLRHATRRDAVRRELAALPRAELLFNYLGQFDQVFERGALAFEAADESIGPAQSPRARRDHPFEIGGLIYDSRLRLTWSYSANRHRPDTAARLLDTLAARVRAIADAARIA
jgi:non-ribosomal peptide synthase protein (TIGR01720 family)